MKCPHCGRELIKDTMIEDGFDYPIVKCPNPKCIYWGEDSDG